MRQREKKKQSGRCESSYKMITLNVNGLNNPKADCQTGFFFFFKIQLYVVHTFYSKVQID